MTTSSRNPKQMGGIIALVAVVLILLLPRMGQLDHFVTSDESRWLIRAGNFYQALTHHDYASTYQHGHPGVSIMWSGLLGYLWVYPEYSTDAPGQFGWKDDAYEDWMSGQNQDPLLLLAAGRAVIVIANVLIFAISFLLLIRLLGLGTAFVATALMALDPVLIGFSRLLHPDGLLSGLMLLSVLAILLYGQPGREQAKKRANADIDRKYFGRFPMLSKSWPMLVLSATCAGLAWLTKTPAFILIPYVVFIVAARVIMLHWKSGSSLSDVIMELSLPLLIWFTVAAAIYVVLWPALWVAPIETAQKVLQVSAEYAVSGHDNAIFYRGRTFFGDPGPSYYLTTLLWRLTPLTIIGACLALGLLFIAKRLTHNERYVTTALMGYVLLFILLMSQGAKKFDRYLLPVYPVLDLVAVIGWNATARWLISLYSVRAARLWPLRPAPRLLIPTLVLIATQATLALSHAPYYINYYNPLLGGGEEAKSILTVGWGEGMDVAARHLNGQNDSDGAIQVASWHRRSPFSYFFAGDAMPLEFFWAADYAVTYAGQEQRWLPSRRVAAFFKRQSSAYQVFLNGTSYANIYSRADAPIPDFDIYWELQGQPVIQLVSYTLFPGVVAPGSNQDLALHLIGIGPVDRNLNILVRLSGREGQELFRADRWPFGAATSDWREGELWLDTFTITIPPETTSGLYRVELSFYDPANLSRLSAFSSTSNLPLGDTVILDYLTVARADERQVDYRALETLSPPPILGEFVSLDGFALPDGPIHSGDSVDVTLNWHMLNFVNGPYTAFAHLVGPDGTLTSQHDQPPLGGFVPMALWMPGLSVSDQYTLRIPENAIAGEHEIIVGMYDPTTLVRLKVDSDKLPETDFVRLGTINITPK